MSSSEWFYIDLMRHGKTALSDVFCGRLNPELSKLGWQQMQQNTQLIDENWQAVYSSPSLRCRDFAETIAQQRQIQCSVEEDLREIYFGEWEGQSAKDLLKNQHKKALQNFWQDPLIHPPTGGESLPDMSKRIERVWQSIILNNKDQHHLLLVVHGGTIRILLAKILELPLSVSSIIEMPPAAISRIRVMRQSKNVVHYSLVFHGFDSNIMQH